MINFLSFTFEFREEFWIKNYKINTAAICFTFYRLGFDPNAKAWLCHIVIKNILILLLAPTDQLKIFF